MRLNSKSEVFFKAISQSLLAQSLAVSEFSGFAPAYGLRSKANFRRTLKMGHVSAPGLDIALKNASLLQ